MKLNYSFVNRAAVAVLAFGAIIVSSGCGGDSDPYYQPWYDVYGSYCGSGDPRPGCNYFSDGYKIRAFEDPYYSSNYYMYGTWTYYDSFGFPGVYTGYAWESPNGIIYDDYGFALNTKGKKKSKDLIGSMSATEEEAIATVGKTFANEHGLDEEQGIGIAETLNHYATLQKKLKRSRTAQDVEDFTGRLYGLTTKQVESALNDVQKGNKASMLTLNEKIAQKWQVAPETSLEIVTKWYGDEMKKYGIHN